MNNLLGSLGLDQVEADPNALPDGKWMGNVVQSELVYVKSKDTLNHVITYAVTEGSHKGARRAEWFPLGTNPTFDEATREPTGYTPTMSDQQKQWYKKRFIDLGVPENEIPTLDIKSLVGTPVTFGTKKNNGYININFAEKREGGSVSPQAPQGQSEGQSGGLQGLL